MLTMYICHNVQCIYKLKLQDFLKSASEVGSEKLIKDLSYLSFNFLPAKKQISATVIYYYNGRLR